MSLQVRTHRYALEKLERQAAVPVGVNAEILVDRNAPAKEIKVKAEILSRRRRIQELQKELTAKTKALRTMFEFGGLFVWLVFCLLLAVPRQQRAPFSALSAGPSLTRDVSHLQGTTEPTDPFPNFCQLDITTDFWAQ